MTEQTVLRILHSPTNPSYKITDVVIPYRGFKIVLRLSGHQRTMIRDQISFLPKIIIEHADGDAILEAIEFIDSLV